MAPGAIILAYHRVAAPPSDARLLCVTPEHFRQHLEVLARYWSVVPLSWLPAVLAARRPFRRVVAVTFDDGYADNLYAAKPLLEQYGIPATVFVTTGYLGGRQFWGDLLEEVLLGPGPVPPVLRVAIGGAVHEWAVDGAARDGRPGARGWHVLQEAPPRSREHVLRTLHALVRVRPDAERRRIAEAVRRWAERPREGHDATWGRGLSADEVAQLAAGGLVEVGAHTVTHPVLALLSVRRQRAEIRKSKARLEAIVGRRVTSFAYPYGSLADYSPATVGMVREAGFERACGFFEGLVQGHTDPYQLPRCGVWDWDGDEFARRLRTWAGL